MTKEDILHHFQDINFRYNDCNMYDDLSRMLDELIAEISGEWIPVSEESLPENFQNVLVTIVRYDGTKMVRMAEYHENPKLSRKTFRILENNERWEVGEEQLLAWMPKPEPYKAESEDT